MKITAEKLVLYRTTVRYRWAQEQQQLTPRHGQAWVVARQATTLLRERFGVNRVVVFGSLVHGHLFHSQSDVDMAVWGLDERKYYRVVAQLLTLDPAIKIDLVMAENVPAVLLSSIETEGIAI